MCSSLSANAMRSGAAQPLSHPSQCKGLSRGERDVLYASVEFIEERTSYHSEVARRVASGALDRAPCASLVLAVTGVGGPGRHEGNPPRLIWLGATLRGHGLVAEQHRFSRRPNEVLAPAIRAGLHLRIRTIKDADAVSNCYATATDWRRMTTPTAWQLRQVANSDQKPWLSGHSRRAHLRRQRPARGPAGSGQTAAPPLDDR